MCSLIKRIQAQQYFVKPLVFIAVISVVFFISFFSTISETSTAFENERTVVINNDLHLKADVSSTFTERRIGLSKYDSLMPYESMLFIFEEQGFHSFWMKDMKFPIDIIWLDEDKKITSIKENADPLDYPEGYYPKNPALYVLETVAGFVSKHDITIGSQLDW